MKRQLMASLLAQGVGIKRARPLSYQPTVTPPDEEDDADEELAEEKEVEEDDDEDDEGEETRRESRWWVSRWIILVIILCLLVSVYPMMLACRQCLAFAKAINSAATKRRRTYCPGQHQRLHEEEDGEESIRMSVLTRKEGGDGGEAGDGAVGGGIEERTTERGEVQTATVNPTPRSTTVTTAPTPRPSTSTTSSPPPTAAPTVTSSPSSTGGQ